MKNKFHKMFEPINIYGLDFQLRYKKEKMYYTNLDILLSLIFLGLFLFVCIIYLKNIINKNDFTIVTNKIQLNKKNEINFSDNPIIFGIFNSQGENIDFDNTYINANLYKNNYNYINNNQINKTQNKINLEICSENNLPSFFLNKVNSRLNISKFLCFTKGQNITISGYYGDFFNLFDILEFHLSKCYNSTNCKSEEEINSHLNNTNLYIIYLSHFIDHYSTNYPINNMITGYNFINSLNSIKRYYFYFSNSKYISDNGLVFSEEKIYNFLEYKETIVDYFEPKANSLLSSKTFLNIAFTIYPYQIIYSRKYIKLQDVLGNIGGCSDILFVFFKLISLYFSERSFLIEISNTFVNKKKLYKYYKNNINIPNSLKEKTKVDTNKFQTIVSKSNINLKLYQSESKNKVNSNSNSFFENENKKKLSHNSRKNNFNLLFKNNFLNSNENDNTIIVKDKNFQREFSYSIFDHCLPFFLMKKINHKDIIQCYENILKKYLSIEVIIPILERINDNITQDKNKKSFFFKADINFMD